MTKVVVYGSLLKGLGNHRVLGDSEFIGECTFQGRMFSLGAYPCVSIHGNTTIKGEMYDVSDSTLRDLDRLEGHPRFYCREVVETSRGPAWVYLINNADQQGYTKVVQSGDWRDYYEHKNTDEWRAYHEA